MLYIFGECTLDTQRYELARAGRVQRLRRKAFQVLAYLLAHADRVVSKHELCAETDVALGCAMPLSAACETAQAAAAQQAHWAYAFFSGASSDERPQASLAMV